MKLLWLGYLVVYSLGNCAMKLYIETDFIGTVEIGDKKILGATSDVLEGYRERLLETNKK